ncbi:9170_t:CDS:2 [Racocetra persica]|uniref:9170_t:CDS:1 n=1 Tax=Racocetra persica TaxID=160502 RepID=A0ACA9KG84_9GLOM|nr:9170_t:CDS:2 [Racocetra persica]
MGKTTIGRLLASNLNYQFIDSGIFYQYLVSKIASQDKQELLSLLQQENIKHIFQLNESVFSENYIKNSSRARYIISGRDSATNIIPDAELKILLIADFETRIQKRINQLKSDNHNTIQLDIIKQDTLSIEFIKEIIKLLTIFIIDTTYLSIEEVIDKILLKTSNMISHNFEKLLAKSLNEIGLVTNIIAYNPEAEEYSIDNIKMRGFKAKKCIKNLKPNSKIIVVFGSIAVEKTTFLNKLKIFFENEGLNVYLPEKMSLRIRKDLEYFYQDTQRYGFMFQDLLIDAYQKENEIIKKDEYDIYLIDRTARDTKIFSKILIDDKLKLDYFKKKLKREEKIDAKYNFFIKCLLKYLKTLCEGYEKNASKLYPKHIVFNTDEAKIEEYNTFF